MNNADLLKHIRSHTGPELKCEKCEYSTKDSRLYKNHQKLHTAVDYFVCDKCEETFKHRNQLRRHQMKSGDCTKK